MSQVWRLRSSPNKMRARPRSQIIWLLGKYSNTGLLPGQKSALGKHTRGSMASLIQFYKMCVILVESMIRRSCFSGKGGEVRNQDHALSLFAENARPHRLQPPLAFEFETLGCKERLTRWPTNGQLREKGPRLRLYMCPPTSVTLPK